MILTIVRPLSISLAILGLAGCGQPANQTANAPAPAPENVDGNVQASSEYDVVRAMLDLAGTDGEDLVVDLGSGDGRIPITAAREKGSRGLGIELDAQLVRQANANATAAGVADKVRFRREDLFVTPLNDVTVLTLFLLPELNLQLRPRILQQMRPGTRVVSNTWDMGDWRPDQRQEIGGTTIFLWVVPARIAGTWRFSEGTATADLTLSQTYQDVTGNLGDAPISEVELRGDRIAFTAQVGSERRRLEGRVERNRIVGTGWHADRVG